MNLRWNRFQIIDTTATNNFLGVDIYLSNRTDNKIIIFIAD